MGDCRSGFRRFHRMIGDFRTRGPLRFPHWSDETEALARQSFDKALFVAGIADRASGSVETGRQRHVRYDTPIPNGVDKVVFADDALSVADQVIEQIKNL